MSRLVRSQEEEEDEVNGRNGAGVYLEIEEFTGSLTEDTSVARRAIAVTALFGSISDARNLYLALPGSTGEGWNFLERLIDPIRKYVIDGDPPYVRQMQVTSEHRGVPTPDGDCAEEALPLEARNPYRAAEKQKWEKTKNGETKK